MKTAHSTSTAAATVSAQRPRAGRGPRNESSAAGTAAPPPSTARTENRGSADRTTARAPTAPPARSTRSAAAPSVSASGSRARSGLRTDDPGKGRRTDRHRHGRGARNRRGDRKRGERKRPQPAADVEAFDRHILDGPSGQHAGDRRIQRNRAPRAGTDRCGARHAPRTMSGREHQSRQHDAARGLPRPMRMVRDRLPPDEFLLRALRRRTGPNGRRRCLPARASTAGRTPRSR